MRDCRPFFLHFPFPSSPATTTHPKEINLIAQTHSRGSCSCIGVGTARLGDSQKRNITTITPNLGLRSRWNYLPPCTQPLYRILSYHSRPAVLGIHLWTQSHRITSVSFSFPFLHFPLSILIICFITFPSHTSLISFSLLLCRRATIPQSGRIFTIYCPGQKIQIVGCDIPLRIQVYDLPVKESR